MTDQDLTVRRARPEDIPGLVASSTALFAEDAGTRDANVDVDWPREHAAASFTAALSDPARLVPAAVHRGEVVGHLTGSVTGPSAMRPVKAATLVSMYVRPAHRRARVGGRMVEEFLGWATTQGAAQVEVTAYSGNADAIRFYERQGFAARFVTLRHPGGGKPAAEPGMNGETGDVS